MLYFIGEKRSNQAIRNNWHWDDNVSTAKYLLDCLKEVGIEHEDIVFHNLWYDDGILNETILDMLYTLTVHTDSIIVGMGDKVCKKLKEHNIRFIDIIHPATRGRIRKKERYIAHLKDKLADVVEQ